jgi:general secretion pathway protein I
MIRRATGFTLLEVVVAMAILSLSLMAIFDLNSGAISMSTYAKKVTVATLLARSKMTDIEQDLYDKGFNVDDEERSGDFSEEGWSSIKWRAKILAPNTQGVSTDQLLGAIFNLPMGGSGGSNSGGGGSGGADPLAAVASMFGAPPGALSGAAAALGASGLGGAAASALGAAGGSSGSSGLSGPFAGLAQGQMTQFMETLRSSVREVHLTITWKDGKQVETVDLVTHVVTTAVGQDRNGTPGSTSQQNNPNDPLVNSRTGQPVPNPITNQNGQLVDPATNDPVWPMSQYLASKAGGPQAGLPGTPQNPIGNRLPGFPSPLPKPGGQ